MSCSPQMLRDVLGYFEANAIAMWVCGGWGEEIRRLTRPRAHADIDLLYPGDSFAALDWLIRRDGLLEIRAKRSAHKRAVVLDGVVVEMFLLRRDDRGPHTLFWGRVRHDWPADVLGTVGRQRVASVTALRSYRAAHHRLHAEGHND